MPGYRNSQRGLYSSMKRRWRQPSRQGRRCGGRLRPSLSSVVGTSAMRMRCSVALMTISDANSMPVVCRRMRWNASREKPRRPQWKSPTGQRKNSLPMPDSTGLPM